MMIKTVILTLAVCLVLVSSCNRFDNTFEPQETDASFEDRIEDFGSHLEKFLLQGEIAGIMEYYADDYLHDGNTKEDVDRYFESIIDQQPDSVVVEFKDTDVSALSFTYSLLAMQGDRLIVDTSFVEFTTSESSGYMLMGNQLYSEETENRRVLVELFTARLCPNCPYVEAALYSLKQRMGDLFYYIEYHMQNPFNFGNQDIAGYYGAGSVPVGIIQGTDRIIGGDEQDSLGDYEYAISQHFNLEEELFFTNFEYVVHDEEISFTIDIGKYIEDIPENLKFKYVLIEKESSLNNLQGEPFRNVVVSKGDLELTGDMFDDKASIDINLELPDFEFNYPAIVVWAQTIEDIYDEDTSLVHNVYEYEIEL